MLKPQTKAPDFSLPDETSATRSLSEFIGKWLLLYFYPKDDTPGCTKEACGIRDSYGEFEKFGVWVVGISKDTPASHAKFKQKYNLPFTLLSDTEKTVIQAYEAWGEKRFMGKTFMGILRISYLISPVGNIEKVYPKVDPASHPKEVLDDLCKLLS